MSVEILTAIENSILNLANKYKLLTEDSNITYESMKNYEAELQNLISRYNEITGIKNYSTSQQIEETLSQMVNSYNDLLTKIDEVGTSSSGGTTSSLTSEQLEAIDLVIANKDNIENPSVGVSLTNEQNEAIDLVIANKDNIENPSVGVSLTNEQNEAIDLVIANKDNIENPTLNIIDTYQAGTVLCSFDNLDNATVLDPIKWSIDNNDNFFKKSCINYNETVLGGNASISYPIESVFNNDDFISFYYWADSFSNYGNIEIIFSNNDSNFYNTISLTLKTSSIVKTNEWNNIRVPISDFVIKGNATLKDVYKQVKIMVWGSGGKLSHLKFGELRLNPVPSTAITFSFDDCNETDYTVAYNKLKSVGFNGISYIISEEIGTTVGNPPLPRLSLEQLVEMHSNGWYIGIHGKDYYNFVTEKNIVEAEESIKACRDFIIDNDLVNDGIKSCAYPHGLYNDDVIQLLKKYGVTNARTTNLNVQSLPVEDIYKLKLGIALSSDLQDNIDKLEKLIKSGGLINVYCHEIYEDRAGITPSVFNAFVDYIKLNYSHLVTTIPDWVSSYNKKFI